MRDPDPIGARLRRLSTCRVGNEDVSIAIWKSRGQMPDWTRSRAVLGRQFADSLGSSPV